MMAPVNLMTLGTVVAIATLITTGLIWFLLPWLARYATVPPNPRSSHYEPTPQGAGIAIVLATLAVTWGIVILWPAFPQSQTETVQLLSLTSATAVLAIVGGIDDVRPLPAMVRLAVQCIAVGGVIAALPNDLRILPQVPWWTERTGLLLTGVWFVNLVNFMDGIDWMTVAEVVPVSGALVLLGITGTLPLLPSIVAAALLGAILGFSPFNKPVARLFLGDVGSLPIGLLLGWLLLELAGTGHLAAAVILPLYYLLDTTITLARRVARGEPFWLAHRSHFYQRATDNGFSVRAIVLQVALVNLALAALALMTVAVPSMVVSVIALAAGVAIVTWLLLAFAREKR
jgi:UDP-N-acetylmuramyl pentapeptide phosphotransferase/UDP-N-acetylglucosamine-1-phosphate transferase